VQSRHGSGSCVVLRELEAMWRGDLMVTRDGDKGGRAGPTPSHPMFVSCERLIRANCIIIVGSFELRYPS
jgi:hypothetical protein